MPHARDRSIRNTRGAQAKGSARSGRRLRVVYFVVALLALILVLSAIYRLVLPGASAAEVKVGARAPALTFTAADGVQHSLSEFHGRPVMLWFFASWCSTCEAGTEAVAHARPSPQWLWGEGSREASYTYDPRGYPDVYFLIDGDGIIRGISGGPNTAIAQILSFARRGR